MKTNGVGNLGVGYAVLDASAPVGGTLLFTFRDLLGSPITEAGVSDSPVGRSFVLPVSFEQGIADTGVAIVNLGADASIQLTLQRDTPQEPPFAMSARDLLAGRHTPQFASQLFESLNDETEFDGTMEISSDQPISVISLRQLILEGLLTTLPVIPLEP